MWHILCSSSGGVQCCRAYYSTSLGLLPCVLKKSTLYHCSNDMGNCSSPAESENWQVTAQHEATALPIEEALALCDDEVYRLNTSTFALSYLEAGGPHVLMGPAQYVMTGRHQFSIFRYVNALDHKGCVQNISNAMVCSVCSSLHARQMQHVCMPCCSFVCIVMLQLMSGLVMLRITASSVPACQDMFAHVHAEEH